MQLMQHIVGNQAFETCVRDVWIEAATAAADATTIAAALSSPTAQQSESERMKQLVSMQHIICTLCPFLRENRTAVAGNMLPSALVQAVADTIDNRVPLGVFTFSSPMLARVELKKAVSFVDVSPGTLTGAKTGRHAQNIPMPLVAPRSADSHAATSSALATCEAFEAFVAENGKPASSFFGPEACVERVLDLVRSVAASDAFVSKDRIRYLLCQAVPYSSSRRSDSSFASLLRMIISMLEGLVHATKHLHVVRVLQVAVAVHFDLLIASANTFSDAAALHKEVMRIFPLSQSAYFVPFSQSFPHLSSSALVITAENIANQRRIGIVDGKETYWLSSLKLPCSIMPCLYGTPNARDYAIDVIDELLTSPGASDRSHLFRSVVSVVTANCPANIGPAVMQCLTSCALLPLNWRTVTWSLALLIGLLPNDDEAVREYVEVIFFNSKDCGAYARGLRCDEVTRGEKRNVDLLAGLFSSVVEDVAAAAFNIVLDAASAQHAPATSEAVTRTYRNVLQKFMKAAAVFAGHISPSTHAQHADALDKSSLSLKAAAEYLEKVSN